MKSIIIVAGAICLVLAVVGFGISVAVIYSQGNDYTHDSESCPTFPTRTSFKAKKVFNPLHWTYKFEDIDGKIQMTCPATNRDANLYIDGKLVVRSDIKSLSLVEKNNIRDCHGNILYVSRTSDFGETLINLNGISVSFELRDANEENVLAYIEGNNFFENNFDIKDANGNIVAHIKREVFSIPWYWEFTIIDATSPGADMRVLSLLAGTRSFEKSGKNDNGDVCNQYFWVTGILVLIVVCIVVLIAIVGVGYLIWTTRCDCSEMKSLFKKIISQFL